MFSLAFTGNVGGEVMFKYAKDGSPFAQFSVAVSNGKDEEPTWFRVTAFGKTAEIFAASMPKKGSRVVVQCDRPPRATMYEKRAGGMGVSLDIKATWIEVAGVSVTTGKDV